MVNRSGRAKTSLFAAVSIVLFLVVGCCTTEVVQMGSPYDRYDHNRTRTMRISATAGSAETVTRVLGDEDYRPSGSEYRGRVDRELYLSTR